MADEVQDRTAQDRTVRLASIVAIDVAGFSSMSERDQHRAAEKIEKLHQRIEEMATKNSGRIFNTAGDGFMLEFGSAGSALGFIQDMIDKRPKGQPPIRVGAHVGDVVVTITNDLLGHGVNIAARLQSLAVPNTALVSGEFRSMARSSPSVAFQAKGRQPLDNINQRVQTFAILSGAQRARRVAIKAAASLAAVAILGALAFFGGQVEQFVQSTGVLQMAGLAPAKPPAEAEAAVAPVPAPEPVPVVTPPPAPAIVRKAGEIFHDCDGCPDMIVVPGGSFMMGSTAKEKPRFPNEGPQREVMLKPFAVSIYETTFNDWDACVADGQCGGFKPADLGWGRGRRPVVGVSWDDAQSYVAWLNTKAGKPLYRLLSEAEWEYLARAGSATPFGPVEKMTRATANYGSGRSDPAGSYAANPFGLYDISGNASEWVADCYVATYEGAPADGRAVAPETCKARVYRGGSYSDAAPALRVADRKKAAPDLRAPNLGFRIARELE